jgi:hypothetical protein
MTASTTDRPFMVLYADDRCLGHVIRRGRDGVEAFDQQDRSLGLFQDVTAAADAISAAAEGRGE